MLTLILCSLFFGVALRLFLALQVRMKWYKSLDSMPIPKDGDEAFPIYFQFGFVEFPFLVTKALEFGLFKTYGIPSISKLLVATAESTEKPFRRYDDTDLLIREFMEHAPNSSRANTALRRLNALHGKYVISNADYLYVLSVFIIEPCSWVDKYGYRKCHVLEKRCAYLIWRNIALKMGMTDIPPSYEATLRYMEDYETAHMVYHVNNKKLAVSSLSILLSNIPSALHPIAHQVVYALCSPLLRSAMGFPDPCPLVCSAIHQLLWWMGVVVRYMCFPRYVPVVRTPPTLEETSDGRFCGCPMFSPYQPTYKDGYFVDELGPEKYKAARELADLKY